MAFNALIKKGNNVKRINMFLIFAAIIVGFGAWAIPEHTCDTQIGGAPVVALPSAPAITSVTVATVASTWYAPDAWDVPLLTSVVLRSVTDSVAVATLTRIDIEAIKGFDDDLDTMAPRTMLHYSHADRSVAINANTPVTDLVIWEEPFV